MADKTTICNQALSALNISHRITSINDDSTEADACLLFWGTTVETVLNAYPWKFATFYRECEKKDSTPLIGFEYEHGLKNDVIRVVAVFDNGHEVRDRGSWKRQGRSILCNIDGPLIVEAITRVDDCAKWSPAFVDAFVPRLAEAIGGELGKKKDVAGMHSLYLSKLAAAKTMDSMEESPPEHEPSEWETAHL